MESGIRNHNLGILFYLICKALPSDTAESYEKIISGVGVALDRLGVSLKIVGDEARKEIKGISSELNESNIRVIKYLSEAGADNFSKIPLASTSLNLSTLSLPSVYLGDGAEARIFDSDKNLLKDVGIEEIFEELYEGQEWVERFSEACTA